MEKFAVGGMCNTYIIRKPRTALFSLSSARRVLPHAETSVPCAEDRLRMRRLVFCVRRTVSACGDWCSANGEFSFICTLYFFLRRLSSTPKRLHFNLVYNKQGGRSQGKGRQINLDLFKIYGLVRLNWQAVVVAPF